MKATIVKINKTKIWFFEKMNKMTNLQPRLIKKKREKNQINKIRDEKGEVTTDKTEIQRIITEYYEQVYANKMDKPLAKLIKNKREKNQINKIRTEKVEVERNTEVFRHHFL